MKKKNRKSEVLVFPMEEQESEKTDIESVVQSLIGAIPATDMSSKECSNGLYYIAYKWRDFEEAIQYFVAPLSEMEGLVTRNSRDYEGADIEIRLDFQGDKAAWKRLKKHL